MDDDLLPDLLLDEPALMGVESIGVDEVKLRMVARTLPGKQFDAGRRLRQMVVAALRRAGVSSGSAATVGVP
jgi:moderate conductance mechanosensitive channel